jgi:hypothetical protein
MHFLLILLLLAVLFPGAMRSLLTLFGWIIVIAAVWIGISVANFSAERRAGCLAHQQDAAWFATNDCAFYLRDENAPDNGEQR